MDRYIGLDVHATSCTGAIIDARGRRLGSHVMETSAAAIIDFLKKQRGQVHLCFEEGTQSMWLMETVERHVHKVVVKAVDAASRGPKSDKLDAFGLAEMMRTDSVGRTVYKGIGPFARLRALVKSHRQIVGDVTRVKCRIKALYRSRAIPAVGKGVYSKKERQSYIALLRESERTSASGLYAQLDSLCEIRDELEKELVAESHKAPAAKLLETCPGVGQVRAAQILATVVTPNRFQRRQKFWSYCGLGIVMRSSSDWVQTHDGRWQFAKIQQTRGLNKKRNSLLKAVFKGAATTVVQQHQDSDLFRAYQRMLDAGTKPNLAKLTLARKIASITLTLWKRMEVYAPHDHADS